MQGFLGTGDLYMDRLTSAGVAQGFVLLGNAVKFEIQPDAETKELVSRKRDTAGQVLASVTKQAPTKINITLNEYDKDTLALAFLGDVTTQNGAGAAVTNENVTAKAGKYVSLAHREVSSVTITHKAADDGTTWATATAYTTSSYVKPTTPNAHFYKCTVAGTSHAATEPTWPTDGTTVTDGTVTWQDMGLITCSATTDYTLNTRTGMFKCLSTGDIVDGEVLNCDYTWAAQDGYDITGGVNPIVKAYFRLDGKNDVNGKKCIVDIYEANVKPSSPIDFLSEDFAELQLEGTLVTPTGLSTPMNIDYHE